MLAIAPGLNLEDLGTLGPLNGNSMAVAINSSGTVVGHYRRDLLDSPWWGVTWRASSGPRELTDALGLPANELLDPSDINDAGAVVGRRYTEGTGSHAFIWTPTEGLLQLPDPGTWPTPGFATAVSNTGFVAVCGYQLGNFGCYRWSRSSGRVNLPGALASANDVNDAGVVVGRAGFPDPEAYRWTPETGMQLLGDLISTTGFRAEATAINKAGVIVGESQVTSPDGLYMTHAFRWTETGGMEDIGLLGGRHARALAINDDGVIVGYSEVDVGTPDRPVYQYRPFRWTRARGMEELPTFPDGIFAASPAYANAINSAGTIVGEGFGQPTGYHALRWTSANRAPIASLSGPSTGVERGALTFTATGSSDADGDALTMTWNWGDGTAEESGTTATHGFADDGAYTVTLTVQDGRGGAAVATRAVAIANSAPAVAKLYLSLPALNRPSVGSSWPLEFTITDRNPSDGPFTFSIDWGDGSSASTGSMKELGLVSQSHVYATPGSRTVTIRLTDKDGGVGVRGIPVEVQP